MGLNRWRYRIEGRPGPVGKGLQECKEHLTISKPPSRVLQPLMLSKTRAPTGPLARIPRPSRQPYNPMLDRKIAGRRARGRAQLHVCAFLVMHAAAVSTVAIVPRLRPAFSEGTQSCLEPCPVPDILLLANRAVARPRVGIFV